MGQERDSEVERTYRDVRDLVERLQHDERKEKNLLLLLGVVAIAVVGFVGLAMALGGSKEKDLARHRCEMEQQADLVRKEGEALKGTMPDPNARQSAIEAKRPRIREAAKAACAGK